MAAPLFVRGVPILCLRLQHHRLAVAFSLFTRRPSSTSAESTLPDDNLSFAVQATSQFRAKERPSYRRIDDPDYRKWKDKEEEILKDIEPITLLVKEIIHSSRFHLRISLTLKSHSLILILGFCHLFMFNSSIHINYKLITCACLILYW